MVKTHKMLLIEERAGMDIRLVLKQAYDEAGNIQRAAELVSDRYREPLSYGLFHDWVQQWGGECRKTLVFPAFEATTTKPAGTTR